MSAEKYKNNLMNIVKCSGGAIVSPDKAKYFIVFSNESSNLECLKEKIVLNSKFIIESFLNLP